MQRMVPATRLACVDRRTLRRANRKRAFATSGFLVLLVFCAYSGVTHRDWTARVRAASS